MRSLFDFTDYKKALKFISKSFPGEKRGLQTRLAAAAGCQQAYLSRVLANRAELSQDQALAVCEFFKLDHLDTDYFLTLVNFNRAATNSLRNYYEAKLEAVRSRKLEIKSRVAAESTLDKKTSATYYSDWSYSAVHMAIACEDLQTVAKLSARFGLPESRIIEVLEFLESVGLAEKKGIRYLHRVTTVHIGSDEDCAQIHHTNWRLRSINALSRRSLSDLNYSSSISCSAEDTTAIREIMLQSIQDIRSVVRDSPSKDVFCYNLDFFKV